MTLDYGILLHCRVSSKMLFRSKIQSLSVLLTQFCGPWRLLSLSLAGLVVVEGTALWSMRILDCFRGETGLQCRISIMMNLYIEKTKIEMKIGFDAGFCWLHQLQVC